MTRQAIFEASAHYFLDPIDHLLDDESVSEIMVNRYDDVYVEQNGKLEHTDIQFANDDALLSAIHNIAQWVGREISEEHPVLDARLPNGSSVHAVIPPSARTGIYLTMRKFTREAPTLDDLVRFASLSKAAKEFVNKSEWWVYGAVSPDGLRWTPLPEPLLKKNSDTQSVCFTE